MGIEVSDGIRAAKREKDRGERTPICLLKYLYWRGFPGTILIPILTSAAVKDAGYGCGPISKASCSKPALWRSINSTTRRTSGKSDFRSLASTA